MRILTTGLPKIEAGSRRMLNLLAACPRLLPGLIKTTYLYILASIAEVKLPEIEAGACCIIPGMPQLCDAMPHCIILSPLKQMLTSSLMSTEHLYQSINQ